MVSHLLHREVARSDAKRLKAAVKERLPPDGADRIAYSAWANAITARVPG